MTIDAPAESPLVIPPSLALIPYAERFLDGRRVVIFGDATLGLAELAAERGARLVHVFDPDAARVAQAVATAERGLSFTVFRPAGGEAGMRDGAFDTCLIPDLALFVDARGLLAQARKLLAASGVVIAATPRVDGRRGESLRGGGPLNYYDFYDVLARQFRSVKMVGQVPFRGYALVDFTQDDEPEVSVDASLIDAEDREPINYVALAGDRPASVEPYAIVQMPLGAEPEPPPHDAVSQATAAALAAQAADLQRAHEARLAQETRLAQEAQRALEVLRAQEAQRAHDVLRAQEVQRAHDDSQSKANALRAELDAHRDRLRSAEAKLAEEQRRGAEMGRALAEAGALPRQLELKLTEEARRAEMLAAQIVRHQENAERLGREVRAHQERSQQAAKALADAQAKLAQLTQREEAFARRIRELEAQPRGVDPARVDALRRKLDEVEAARAQAETARVQAEAARIQAEAARAQTETALAQAEAARVQAETGRVQAEAARVQTEAALAQAEAARTRAEAERDDLRRKATHQGELRRVLDEREQQLAALRQQASAFHQQLVQAQAQAQQVAIDFQEEQASHVADLSAAEAALRERARENALLRAEVERRGGMVRELLQALDAREPAPLGAAGALDRERLGYLEHELTSARSRLETLTAQMMRREAELSAAQARLAEAERQAASARAGAAERQGSQPEPPPELGAALAELDALRLALQQERAARAALEARADRSDPSFSAALRAQVEGAADAGSVDR